MANQYAEDIRAERNKRKLSQKEVAKRRRIYRTTLIDIENGTIGVDLETFQSIVAEIQGDQVGEEASA